MKVRNDRHTSNLNQKKLVYFTAVGSKARNPAIFFGIESDLAKCSATLGASLGRQQKVSICQRKRLSNTLSLK